MGMAMSILCVVPPKANPPRGGDAKPGVSSEIAQLPASINDVRGQGGPICHT